MRKLLHRTWTTLPLALAALLAWSAFRLADDGHASLAALTGMSSTLWLSIFVDTLRVRQLRRAIAKAEALESELDRMGVELTAAHADCDEARDRCDWLEVEVNRLEKYIDREVELAIVGPPDGADGKSGREWADSWADDIVAYTGPLNMSKTIANALIRARRMGRKEYRNDERTRRLQDVAEAAKMAMQYLGTNPVFSRLSEALTRLREMKHENQSTVEVQQ